MPCVQSPAPAHAVFFALSDLLPSTLSFTWLTLHPSGLSVNSATPVMNGALMAGPLQLPGGAGGSMEPASNRPELEVSHGATIPQLLPSSSPSPLTTQEQM